MSEYTELVYDVATGETTTRPLTPEEITALSVAIPLTEEQARAQRDALLAGTDWVVARAYEDGTPVPPQWATYRQALRDIPQQVDFPANIQWPTKP